MHCLVLAWFLFRLLGGVSIILAHTYYFQIPTRLELGFLQLYIERDVLLATLDMNIVMIVLVWNPSPCMTILESTKRLLW